MKNKEILIKELTSKIKIVPHGVDIKLFKPKKNIVKIPESGFNREKEPFRFLCNKGWRGTKDDRGGVQYVLKAFTDEFEKDENVELNLHINPAYVNPETVKPCMDALGLNKDSPPIKVSATNIPYKKLPALYQSADCYVCATRAEAFDLGTAEAMACGLSIITTGYGGQVEHMDKTCSDLIDYKLEEVKDDIQYEGISWGVPNILHLRKLLRAAFSDGQRTREMGQNAREFIKPWTWENSATKALEILKE